MTELPEMPASPSENIAIWTQRTCMSFSALNLGDVEAVQAGNLSSEILVQYISPAKLAAVSSSPSVD